MKVYNHAKLDLIEAAACGELDKVEYLSNIYRHSKELMYLTAENDRNALHNAENVEVAKLLLETVDSPLEMIVCGDDFQDSAVHTAAEAGRCDVVAYLCSLLSGYELLGLENRLGSTPLHLAKSPQIAKILLETIPPEYKELFLMTANNVQSTVLHEAASRGSADVIQYVCRQCIDPSELLLARDYYGNTALHYAINLEVAENLINSAPDPATERALILAVNRGKETVLHQTIRKPGLELLVEYLCTKTSCGSDLMSAKNIGAVSVLCEAINTRMAKVLIEPLCQSEKLNYVLSECDLSKRTLLHRAALEEDCNLIKYLLEDAGISSEDVATLVLQVDYYGESALFRAKDPETIDLLVGSSNNILEYIDIENIEGDTAIMHFCKLGLSRNVTAILEIIEDEPGSTTEDMKRLLEKPNHSGQNIFHIASISPLIEELVTILSEFVPSLLSVNLMRLDSYKNSPLTYALSRFSPKVFANFIMRVPLAQRQQFLNVQNHSGVDGRKIIALKELSEDDYLQDILGTQRPIAHLAMGVPISVVSDLLDDMEAKSESNSNMMLRIMLYALNEYLTSQHAFLTQPWQRREKSSQLLAIREQDATNGEVSCDYNY